MSELLPCPFCGKPARSQRGVDGAWYTGCADVWDRYGTCNGQQHAHDQETAETLWNVRVVNEVSAIRAFVKRVLERDTGYRLGAMQDELAAMEKETIA
jgi:ssDNA-binding Zn-finger/Zn-ribbon topoisomerase 1